MVDTLLTGAPAPATTKLRARTQHTRTTLPRPRMFPAPPPTVLPEARPVRPAPPDPETGSLLERHPVTPPLTVSHVRSITGALAERLWDAYLVSFGPLEELAILKHLDSHEDMLAMFANQRILKLVAWQGAEPVGLGMVTNCLEDVAEISPRFLRSKYPEFAARDAIYVGMLVMVAPNVRGMAVFRRIYMELWQVPAKDHGILVFDVCEFNRVAFEADTYAERVTSNFPHASVEVLDRQTWYVAHLPEPLPDRRPR